MLDTEIIIKWLLTKQEKFSDSSFKEGRGFYALSVSNPQVLYPIKVEENGLIYIGMTAKSFYSRNHFTCPHSGGSSPRRSLGAILKEQYKFVTIKRDNGKYGITNYRFRDSDEIMLTEWMKVNLKRSHYIIPNDVTKKEILEHERIMIEKLQPPLNLDKWKNPQSGMIDNLREICREEARIAPSPASRERVAEA